MIDYDYDHDLVWIFEDDEIYDTPDDAKDYLAQVNGMNERNESNIGSNPHGNYHNMND